MGGGGSLLDATRILGGRRISVNVSPLQFRHSDFVSNLMDVLRSAHANPKLIELEITESMLLDDDKRAVQILKYLKNIGFFDRT